MYTAAVGRAPDDAATRRRGDTASASAFLTDFGLAKSVSTGSRFTRTGVTLGTPAYMSPEQARGDLGDIAPATDVWGLGCVLYEMLAGRRAFGGDTPAEAVGQVLLREPETLARLRRDAPGDLHRLVAACLQKVPARRTRDGAALRDDLARTLAGEPIRSRPPRGPGLAWGVALAGLAAAAVASVWALAGASPPAPTPPPAPAGGAAEAEALASRARSLRALDPGQAARLLERALSADPGSPARHAWQVERGLCLWAIRRGEEAREAWGLVPLDAAESAAARLYLGMEAFSRRRAGEARDDIEAAAARGGPYGRLARGTDALARRSFAEARELLRAESGWEAAFLRGTLEAHDPDGDLGAALHELDQALSGGLPLVDIHAARGAIRGQLGDYRGAVEDLDAALRLAPGDPAVLYNRANARHRLGDHRGAIQDADAALLARPDLDTVRFIRAMARGALGDIAGAEADYGEEIRVNPRHANSWNQRGLLRLGQGRSAEALADLDQALKLNPEFPEAYTNRAWARRELGDMDGALADQDAALRIQPDHPDALNNRGNLRREMGDLEGALEDLEAALRLRPDDPGVHANLGLLHNARGDLRAAAAELREFLRLAPGHPHAENFRGFLGKIEARLREEAGPGR